MRVRDAEATDAGELSRLVAELGYAASPDEVAARLIGLAERGEPVLVAAEPDGGLAGCLTWHVTPVLHRPTPVGRVTMLVISERYRGGGIGRALVDAAEARLQGRGCALAEVTSNMRREAAHAFYEHLGYERTSFRLAKVLRPELAP